MRGVGDSFWGTFGELFTVYGGCQVNIGAVPPEKWPIMAAIIRYAAEGSDEPGAARRFAGGGDLAEDPGGSCR